VGGAHTVAYALGGLWLMWRLRPRVGSLLSPTLLRPLALSVCLGGLAWVAMEAWSPEGRLAVLVALAVIGGSGAVAYVAALRALGGLPGGGPAVHRAAGAS
jgi:hypothetical protein